MHLVLRRVDGGVLATPLTDAGTAGGEPVRLDEPGLPAFVAAHDAPGVRWVWDDTARWYPAVLAAGGRVGRCVDLRLGRRVLRAALAARGSVLAAAPADGLDAPVAEARVVRPTQAQLFDDALFTAAVPDDEVDPVAEFRAQLAAVAGSSAPGALRLLLTAESAGALVAAEMLHAGLPWRADVHERLLEDALGPRVPYGVRPRRLEEIAAVVRERLDDPGLNPDSPADVLKALRRVGLMVTSTRKWELQEIEHPVIEPLLEYKRLARLLTANGWTWLDDWIRDGRFHPKYVVGGVVTGRWAADGGGAMQLPKGIRGAVIADPGWKLVVADAAQLEPRVLAAMSGDRAMAAAGDGRDLYDGVVASGAVETRQQAKVAMLGAMYGATQGEGGRLVPRLVRAFPQALDMVERAARAGERGQPVTTLLGRTSPMPEDSWFEARNQAYTVEGTPAMQRAVESRARSWGRFTRNFVVQGTAAEWALAWMGSLRSRLLARFPGDVTDGPHLVFFVHDEIVVHAPAEHADWVAQQIREAAVDAGRLLFQDFPVTFPLSVAVVGAYSEAKD
ncbi:bifunctional 3'-5' exonuclease/DNA polymerase [Curtobacterium flaccumfaciens pv. flaccumfaciens]|uniref:DNA-directed DNA polymerase n=1 Tax=Curtobacterium poinsettiae TaxID=159612 RepID=A0ABT3S0L3_9MICO|nr:bifunctional 3'-5' exonuclease/DNA polymerase [Curtobacterium flaccumfaciens]MBT1608788.1 bifunctional 3'-5' exonuclease/DNA polymerase [Curtobacterium flaccumfaciens pv. poinsettiae]MCS6574037.1 bifunctional 3'-5' exonuclease/DNA polymerase [Curtobacterium flaccumfaciens pv. flaccumfaciens]MCX2848295.1 bifunctional 3'-5' exonuclease/DNA polymerase [Curtobacterium flaccumfaciens pv. poinsettiae]UXN18889.1 bifunctional 3'-5' exonuclease/DNA polymerase [Curtobacterium flaccumfaciens pv. poinse